MFGRYSLDKEELILASQGETLEDYLKKIKKLDALHLVKIMRAFWHVM